MSSPYNNVIYWSGTMLDSDGTVDDQIQVVKTAGFRTIVLWSLHISAEGYFAWNDTPIVAPAPGGNANGAVFDPEGKFTKLAARVAELLNNGDVQDVLVSIGAGGVHDFTHVKSLIQSPEGQQTLKQNFLILKQALPMVTGFDFDNEDYFADNEPVVWLTETLAVDLGAKITYCPYPLGMEPFWAGCMSAVYKKLGTQPVLWWNLQCYSGGQNNNSKISEWIGGLPTDAGIPDPNAFVIPMFAAVCAVSKNQPVYPSPSSGIVCPDMLASIFQGYQGIVPGGGLWQTQHVFDNEYAKCPPNNTIPKLPEYTEGIDKGLG